MTKTLTILAPAKINLCLDVLEKDLGGYHKIRSIIYEIPEFHDSIKISASTEKDDLTIANPHPKQTIQKEDNLAWKAIQLLRRVAAAGKPPVHVEITKNIPVSSGLGGGSSDAAATFKALKQFWDLNLSDQALQELAAQISMDTAFFIKGGTALAENYGEKITQLPSLDIPGLKLTSLSGPKNKTVQAYSQLDLSLCAKNTDKTEKLLQIIHSKAAPNPTNRNLQTSQKIILSPQELSPYLHNDFETLTPPPKNSHLTGAGPSYFRLDATNE